MSDISGPLQAAIATGIRADAGVIAAFGANPVKVFDIPPVNDPAPYLTLGPPAVDPIHAEGFDLSETSFPVHVWSLTSPPSFDEAYAIAAALQAVLRTITVTAGGRVYAVIPGRVDYLVDPSDDRTIHAVIPNSFTTAPA